jgi:hypothetical protein
METLIVAIVAVLALTVAAVLVAGLARLVGSIKPDKPLIETRSSAPAMAEALSKS